MEGWRRWQIRAQCCGTPVEGGPRRGRRQLGDCLVRTTHLPWPERGGARLQGAGPLWESHRIKIVRDRKGTETDSCPPLRCPPVLHSCPSPLFPFLQLGPSSPPKQGLARPTRKARRHSHCRCGGRSQTTDGKAHTDIVWAPSSPPSGTSEAEKAPNALSLTADESSPAACSTAPRRLLEQEGSFLLHQFFSGSEQKSITAHLEFTAFPIWKSNF